MPPRTPLAPITPNVIRKKQLSPYSRGKIIGAYAAGAKIAQIARLFSTPDSTVRRTIANEENQPHGLSLPKPGRPILSTVQDERSILRFIRSNPKTKYSVIKHKCGLEISHSAIKRILRKHGIQTWRAKKRPELTPLLAAKRLAWAKVRENWTVIDFYNHMFSDECSAERGKGKDQEWCFGSPTNKWKPAFVTTYQKSKDISVMVWACFWYEDGKIQRSELYIMDRDFESKKHGYSANSYLEVLENNLPFCWSPGLVFMHDNASIHTAHAVTNWFIDMGIPLADHPPFSPDMNPIEHLWFHLKKQVQLLHPELANMGKGENDLIALEQALIEAWQAIPTEIFQKVLDSMPKRVAALIAAEGWHTKY
jgi:transposase